MWEPNIDIPITPRVVEIAQITLLNVFPGLTPIGGEVRATDAPRLAVPLPPIPAAVPEPASLGSMLLVLTVLSRRR
jgi:hypothetical protein